MRVRIQAFFSGVVMTAAPVSPHPLLAAVATARTALGDVAGVEPVYASPVVRQELLVELAALEAQAAGLRLSILAASEDLAEKAGARDAGAWFAHATRADRRTAHGDSRLARALDEKHAVVGAALRAGELHLDQARVIARALDRLPDEVDQITRKRAERHLVELANEHDPADLRRLGDHLLEVIAPEVADQADARALEREEQRARERCSLRIKDRGDGTGTLHAVLPISVLARLTTYLDAATSPRVATGERVPLHRARGHAFAVMLERLDVNALPDHGGDATTVLVTIDLDALKRDLATAGMLGNFDGDLKISATEARRLACNARIIPVVLGGKGEVLDLGRARRLFSPAQRKALRIRDKACRGEGCTMPAAMCEAHHLQPWSQGGRTDLADGVLLCSHHHHVIHDTRFTATRLPNGDLRFHRRT
jgi:hypothetical protein